MLRLVVLPQAAKAPSLCRSSSPQRSFLAPGAPICRGSIQDMIRQIKKRALVSLPKGARITGISSSRAPPGRFAAGGKSSLALPLLLSPALVPRAGGPDLPRVDSRHDPSNQKESPCLSPERRADNGNLVVACSAWSFCRRRQKLPRSAAPPLPSARSSRRGPRFAAGRFKT